MGLFGMLISPVSNIVAIMIDCLGNNHIYSTPGVYSIHLIFIDYNFKTILL